MSRILAMFFAVLAISGTAYANEVGTLKPMGVSEVNSFFSIYESEDGYRWNLNDGNGEIIAHSGEAFSDMYAAERSIEVIRWEAAGAAVVRDESAMDTDSGYRFEYYQSERDGMWYWRFRSDNHQTMAVGEGYTTASNARKAIENVRVEMVRAEIR